MFIFIPNVHFLSAFHAKYPVQVCQIYVYYIISLKIGWYCSKFGEGAIMRSEWWPIYQVMCKLTETTGKLHTFRGYICVKSESNEFLI